jgi:hypothetical protein
MFNLNCSICNKEFISHVPHAKACSEECKYKYRRAYANKYYSNPNYIEKYRSIVRKSNKKRRMNKAVKEKEMLKNYEWRKLNPEKWKALKKRDYDKHPERAKLAHIKRKHNMRSAGKLPDMDIIKKRMNLFDGCCYCKSKKELTLEHFIPINKFGKNFINNIFGSCLKCNVSKQDKPFLEWYRKQKFYDPKREYEILQYSFAG